MLNKITSTPKKIATHVAARRGRYGVAAGFVTGAIVARKLDASTYGAAIDFLKEKDLHEEFFTLSEAA